MEEQLYLTNLYEYYKGLLTEKQRTYFEDYFFDNLTIMEIAENNNISKNAVSKSIIEVKEKLEELESILNLYHKSLSIKKIVDKDTYEKIIDYI